MTTSEIIKQILTDPENQPHQFSTSTSEGDPLPAKTEVTKKHRKPHPYREAMRKLTNAHIDVDMLQAKLKDAEQRLANAQKECERTKPGPGTGPPPAEPGDDF